jgi:molybdopterin synthase catalytic subunit
MKDSATLIRGKALVIRTWVHKKGTIDLHSIIKNARTCKSFQKVGGMAFFVGVVRNETVNKETVMKLEIEAYEEQANTILEKICNELKNREGIVDVQIHHMLGEFEVGEELVYVLVAGSHRKDLFPTLYEAVERYKREVPIFKKEYIVDEKGQVQSYWENQPVKTL